MILQNQASGKRAKIRPDAASQLIQAHGRSWTSRWGHSDSNNVMPASEKPQYHSG
jgi:hypothetical protein